MVVRWSLLGSGWGIRTWGARMAGKMAMGRANGARIVNFLALHCPGYRPTFLLPLITGVSQYHRCAAHLFTARLPVPTTFSIHRESGGGGGEWSGEPVSHPAARTRDLPYRRASVNMTRNLYAVAIVCIPGEGINADMGGE